MKIAVIVWSLGLGYAGVASAVHLYRAADFLPTGDRLQWALYYAALGLLLCGAGLLFSRIC